MSDTSSRLLRALRNLLLAMINATLILIALCLFLGLRLADRVDTIGTNFARNLVSVQPLRDDVQTMTAEIASLRTDLADVRTQTGELTSTSALALSDQLESFELRMDQVRDRMTGVQGKLQSAEFDPEALLDHAIETAAAEFGATVGLFAGCQRSDVGAPEKLNPPAETAGGQ